MISQKKGYFKRKKASSERRINVGSTLLTIEDVNQFLKQWEGKYIKISKYEKKDHDETLLKLDNVSYAKKTRRIDDYESKYTLQLNGAGKVRISRTDFQPLPNSLYEIPLEDNTQYKYDGARVTLNTDRGVYTIEITSEFVD